MKIATFALVLTLNVMVQGQTWVESTLVTLNLPFGSGGSFSGLIIDSSGNIYATGPSESGNNFGSVYKITSQGVLTDLYDFTSATGSPAGMLTRDSAGSLYGTTGSIVYKVSSKGKETTLHTFAGGTGAGFPLRLDSAGNLYGYFYTGSSYAIFKLTPKGKFSTLHTFLTGNIPNESLIIDSAGNFYGMAQGGTLGYGFIFKMTPAFKYSVLYNFTGGSDGALPTGKLVQNKSGLMYGTAEYGGELTDACSPNNDTPTPCGTVFSITSTGVFSVLYSFTGNNYNSSNTDGSNPYGALVLDPEGNIYGISLNYGYSNSSYDYSTQFQITPSGIETTIGGVGEARDGIVIDKAGNLYGVSNSFGCCETYTLIYKLTKN